MKLDHIPFLDLVKEASERLTGLLADIHRGLIDEGDIPQERKDNLAAWCEDIAAEHRALCREVGEIQAKRFFERYPDPHAGLRHSQHERL